ncbi:XylR N-terminal domain-containing protein [Thermoactinomyces mirandus]|uniref:XylR N-terminal domain-containing protein n=1 Tax=Thermoactinomyces mirandus TaxID=2756294 RepID=A0A7W1XQM0_9BACL|nr:XylR N-terminal domain-containing protein [Thermoactinomyces mirandus]MBA4601396.1 XylR N-terminal domain-containing protein [Thermoactinomyces mirandus]
MESFRLELNQLYSDGKNDNVSYERVITIPISAMGTLRTELIETLGRERAKGFLLRYGWHCGMCDGNKAKKLTWKNDEELVLAGPRLHTLHGHVHVVPDRIEVDIGQGRIYLEGYWKNSYEAREQIRLFGVSKKPVCHFLSGYASGYLSTVMGKKVIAYELQCEGMGDSECHWVCKSVEDWGEEIAEELKFYEVNNIIDELDQTYKKLKHERDNLSKAYQVHRKLMKEILQQNHLISIANVLYQSMGIKVLIEDSHLDLLAAGGVAMKEAENYSKQFKKSFNTDDLVQTSFLVVSKNHRRLITPIYLRRKVIGYCSFLYQDSYPREVDKLILEQAALTCSLHMLNERIRVQVENRMRGNLLEDILNHRITQAEMIKRTRLIGFNWKNSGLFMIAFNQFINHQTIEDELEFNDRFIVNLLNFFKHRNLDVLIGQKAGHVVILLVENKELENPGKKEELCRTLIRYFSKRYKGCCFKLGISSSSCDIKDVSNLYEEALACLKIADNNEDVIFFDSLGIVGILFQTRNLDGLRRYAHKILGSLIKEDKPKNMQLTKTLYHYLNNASNIHKTARAMNFSVSGLRYRLNRITEILQVDLTQPSMMHQIYLALQSLIVLGELDIREGKAGQQ